MTDDVTGSDLVDQSAENEEKTNPADPDPPERRSVVNGRMTYGRIFQTIFKRNCKLFFQLRFPYVDT